MNYVNVEKFETSDFYVAAYLRTVGLKLLEVNRENPRRLLFVFEDTKDRQDLVEDFLFGRASVEPKIFVSAIKELKQLLHADLGVDRSSPRAT